MSATGLPSSRPERSGQLRVRLGSGPEAILDSRRALFVPDAGILALADLHLGYTWVQRRRGALLPVNTPDTAGARFESLIQSYQPKSCVLVGDVVHQAVALPAIQEELQTLARRLPVTTEWIICPGNHDQQLPALLTRLGLRAEVTSVWTSGRYRFHHGDRVVVGTPNATGFALQADSDFHIIGHEHPALRLGDGVATSAKVPCFLLGANALVLPAFSDWASGCEVGRAPFLGPLAQTTRFESAIACLGPRLLRIPLRSPDSPKANLR